MAKEKKKTDKSVVKAASRSQQPKKQQRYIHINNVDARKADGWGVVEETGDRKLGVKTGALGDGKYQYSADQSQSDLVLMEK